MKEALHKTQFFNPLLSDEERLIQLVYSLYLVK